MNTGITPKLYIGIDIGGTNIRGVLWDGKKVIRAAHDRTINNRKGFSMQLKKLVAKLERGYDGRVIPLGIGAAGVVRGTKLAMSPNISALRNFDFRAIWRSRKLFLDNDARCFARAEAAYGAGRNAKRFFAVTLGTGVGRAFVNKGKALKIKRFEYPESWEAEYQKIHGKSRREELAALLAERLAPLISRFKPDLILIGGGVGLKLYGSLKSSLKRKGLKAAIKRSSLNNAAALGAAMLVAK